MLGLEFTFDYSPVEDHPLSLFIGQRQVDVAFPGRTVAHLLDERRAFRLYILNGEAICDDESAHRTASLVVLSIKPHSIARVRIG